MTLRELAKKLIYVAEDRIPSCIRIASFDVEGIGKESHAAIVAKARDEIVAAMKEAINCFLADQVRSDLPMPELEMTKLQAPYQRSGKNFTLNQEQLQEYALYVRHLQAMLILMAQDNGYNDGYAAGRRDAILRIRESTRSIHFADSSARSEVQDLACMLLEDVLEVAFPDKESES